MPKQKKETKKPKKRKQTRMELRNKRKIQTGMMELLQGYLVVQSSFRDAI